MKKLIQFHFLTLVVAIFLSIGVLEAKEEKAPLQGGVQYISSTSSTNKASNVPVRTPTYYYPSAPTPVSAPKGNQKGFWFKNPSQAPYQEGGIYIP